MRPSGRSAKIGGLLLIIEVSRGFHHYWTAFHVAGKPETCVPQEVLAPFKKAILSDLRGYAWNISGDHLHPRCRTGPVHHAVRGVETGHIQMSRRAKNRLKVQLRNQTLGRLLFV